jgi:hypothetical protein
MKYGDDLVSELKCTARSQVDGRIGEFGIIDGLPKIGIYPAILLTLRLQ